MFVVMHDLSTLPGRLKWARFAARNADEKEPSARSMSELAGLSVAMWALLESGDRTSPAASTILAIASAIGVSAEWLFAGEGAAPTEADVHAAVERTRAAKHTASDLSGPAAKAS